MDDALKIGIAGLGTVGTGVLHLLSEHGDLLAARSGRRIEVVAVSARDRSRERGMDLSALQWCDDPVELATLPGLDVVVEAIGGADGPALDLARAALGNGRAVVTANKAMIAEHGYDLAQLAGDNGAAMLFEAAVCAGTPILQTLRDGLSGNRFDRIEGILNGTSNYILSAMERSGEDFADTLREAQQLGYAEADPALDVDGGDAAHKLAILAALAFGVRPDFASVEVEGIRAVRAADIMQAERLGYVVRLVAMADLERQGGEPERLLQRVRPCLLPANHPLAAIDGPTNAVLAQGDFSGPILIQGAGAGREATASGVVADLVSLARGQARHPFAVAADALATAERADSGAREARYYLRFVVADRPGVLAELAAAMRDARVSIQSLIQEGESVDPEEAGIMIALVTHKAPARNVRDALMRLQGADSVVQPPLAMPILQN
ncbi:homoserine dehydrogenase [Alteriqipengyuania lutimaris]|uniref:Homoserine dehydrogenase n=1 Tax=Alteriqipengyuania lutimaris TaxID=1538146 RepID=A0A395LPH8_9SPHN|nr:homoserine dehydrogenase [Alteriqipengyuania lutimaris]MBB3034501.1 homoserine dehydrogenase [Alteriqipengyuania lutimaris]RDS76610.1 homoserine dehydrogenase [Alteriqipengyuania lutimaris]